MPNLGPAEILVILVVALIVFGPKKLPEIGKSIGKGLREFKKASNEIMSTFEADDDDYTPPRAKENGYHDTDSVGTPGTGTADNHSGSTGAVRGEEAP